MEKHNSEEQFHTILEITDLTSAFMPAQIVLTANRLELFTKLSGRQLTAQSLAEHLKTEPRATEMLCQALTSLGFLEKEQDFYKNSVKAETHLVKSKPFYCGDNLKLQAKSWEKWSHLEETVRTGRRVPEKPPSREQGKQQILEFTLAMANIGQVNAAQTIEGLDLRGVEKVIDIGGGPGTYTLEFVKKNNHIQASIFDQPDVVAIAKQRFTQSPYSKNISTLAGDCFTDDLGSDYDLAFLSNLIHIYSIEEIVKLFKRVWQALKPNDRIVVKDFFVNDQGSGPQFATQFALHMLLHTDNGCTYSFQEIKKVFQEAKFQWINSFEVGKHSTVIIGEKTN